ISSMSESPLGTVSIAIDQIAGTLTASRRDAFSPSFYPLLEEDSEFAAKWTALAKAHLEEGIQEPITALEYLNRFYVVEGHKRVSVLRYFGATTVSANVRRILPPRSDAPEVQVYYEFLEFYRITRVNYIQFSRLGSYPALLKLLCGGDQSVWDEERQRSLSADVTRFRQAFRSSPLYGVLTQDKALLRYLQIFGLARLQERTPTELKSDLAAIAPELVNEANAAAPAVQMTPTPEQPKTIISRIIHPAAKVLKVAFLHDKTSVDSYWTYTHEQGRLIVQKKMAGQIETASFFNMLQEDFDARVAQLAKEGYDVIFTTTARLLAANLKAAGAYPNIKFLNCSLNVSHPILRTYYGRLYEAKFLTGVIAGAMSENGRIGYVCDYPNYGTPASINAFALGAQMANPSARVYLEWSTVPGIDIPGRFAWNHVTAVAGQDMFDPKEPDRPFGVSLLSHGRERNIALSYWNWGSFYEKILRSVLDGSWSELEPTAQAGQTINYWWGLSTGVIDVHYTQGLPPQTKRLVQLLRRSIIENTFHPLEGPVFDNHGVQHIGDDVCPTPEENIKMDWLASNVVGSIPSIDQLTPEAQKLVRLQGVLEQDKEGTV
ncbi:MAG: BMP family ABC transporter substrate-binding protein, partial [Oscillospiraceae bacterium]|nr:BMP family ABC transporter substrate-binding protein [Oscillospiraceae bacterium]